MSGRDVLMGGRKIKGYAHLDECLWWRLLLWKQYQQNQLKYYDRSIILLIKFHKYSKHLHKLHESKEQKVRHVISPPSQVKFLVQVVAMGGSFSGRRSSCPDWPSWCLPGPLSHCLGHCTPLHTGLCSPLWKERETSCHLVIGGERGVRGRTGEDYDAIIIMICEDEVWSLNIEMQITWWKSKDLFHCKH